MNPLFIVLFVLFGAVVWATLSRVRPDDLSQAKHPSNLGSGKWSW